MQIVQEVESCYECPHSTNSSLEHDCAFTCAPYPTRWWCKHEANKDGLGDHLMISEPQELHPDCKVGK